MTTEISPELTAPINVGKATGIVPAPVSLSLLTPDTSHLTPLHLQPIADLAAYLRTRTAAAHYRDELALYLRLPSALAKEVRALLDAFEDVMASRRKGLSVSRACAMGRQLFSEWGWNDKTFRGKYDLWIQSRDWLVLVNRAKCGGDWVERGEGLSKEFLDFVAVRFGQFARADGKRQAIHSIFAQWRSGQNPWGVPEMIPGYEAGWESRNPKELPAGFSYSNILRQVKARGKFTKAHRAFLHEGEAAARAVLPQVLGTRGSLGFLEHITFDDVRTDWLVFNPQSGCAEELWLLVARDTATAMVLGFVMHPATVREDGTASHLGLAQMKQLAGWMLERYPLPPYVVTWKIERGTATLSEGMRLALAELLGRRIVVSYTSMIGSESSPAGYAEKKKGNSRGKASHESHNRLFHTQGSYISGQTGNLYGVRPADLNARAAEAVEIWHLRERLPEHLRGTEKYPLLTLHQARTHLFKFCNDQNHRTDHKLEGFEEVLEKIGVRYRKRMESPIERAARLAHGLEWTPVSPAIVATFYEHSERPVVVQPNGEIEFQHEGRSITFANAGGVALVPGAKALGYFHPDDPAFLHLTDGRGAVLGTWVRRNRVAVGDAEHLAEALRYTHIAREAARAAATILAAPQRAELASMRAHNAELLKLAEFTDVTAAPSPDNSLVGAPAGAALTAVSRAVKADKKRAAKRAADLRAFSGGMAELAEPAEVPGVRCEVSGEDDFSAEGLL